MTALKKIPSLCVVSSYEFADTNATKSRLKVYVDILSNRFNIALLAPIGNGSVEIIPAEFIAMGQAPARGNFAIRAIREFNFSLKALLKIYQLKPDIVLVSIPSMFLLLIIKLKLCLTILDIRDLTWEYLPNSNYYYRVVRYLLRTFARNAIQNADMVLVTNSSEYNYINSLIGIREVHTPVSIVRNGITSSRFAALRAIPDNRDPAHPVLLYAGNVGVAQNLTTIIDVANVFPRLRVFIVGEGNDLERVQKYSKDRLVHNVTFVGGVLWEDLKSYYSKASILYAQIGTNYESAIPSKLYEYLTIGIPIIYGGRGVASEFLAEFDDIQLVEPDNQLELSRAVSFFLKRDKLQKKNKNAEIIRNKYIREKQVKNLIDTVYELHKKCDCAN